MGTGGQPGDTGEPYRFLHRSGPRKRPNDAAQLAVQCGQVRPGGHPETPADVVAAATSQEKN